jgi:hypothetical protein
VQINLYIEIFERGVGCGVTGCEGIQIKCVTAYRHSLLHRAATVVYRQYRL